MAGKRVDGEQKPIDAAGVFAENRGISDFPVLFMDFLRQAGILLIE